MNAGLLAPLSLHPCWRQGRVRSLGGRLLVRKPNFLQSLSFLLLPFFFLLLLLICATSVSSEEYPFQGKNPRCVPVTIDLCSDIQYNMTIFPNLLKHTRQEEAEADIERGRYKMLVDVRCSPDFKLFLCTLFVPVCTVLEEPIPPCKRLCLSAKSGCDNLMRKFGYTWPEIFDCENFVDDGMCVGETHPQTSSAQDVGPGVPALSGAESAVARSGLSTPQHHQPAVELECPHTMKVLSRSRYTLAIANSTIEQCSLPCQNDGIVSTLVSTPVRHYLRLWTGAWAVCCFICTLFTLLSFLITAGRYEYPERAILQMSLCYMAVSLIYMVGLVAEDGISCSGMSATKAPLVAQGIDSFACTALAAAHYFFTTAGLVWWLVLCFSWFLVTTLKWGEAPVANVFSSYFNMAAWFVPALMVIAVLVTNSVDGDLLSGVCSIGNLQPDAILTFIVFPQALLIGLGLIFFTSGLISIARIRSYIKGQRVGMKLESTEVAAEKMGRLMLRISSFALFYIVPVIVGELALYYQATHMKEWLTSWYSTRCLHAQRGAFGFTQSRELCPLTDHRGASMVNRMPDPTIFFLKYLSYFGIGLACAVWTSNGKTIASYSDFYARIFHPGRTRVPTRVI